MGGTGGTGRTGRKGRKGKTTQGWQGWDEYAPFYDWENARTLGRRDLAFWKRFTAKVHGPVLELGCGTGRVTLPLARAGVDIVGLDRSEAMLARATKRIPSPESRSTRSPRTGSGSTRSPQPEARIPHLVRGDIRALPFPGAAFSAVLAPYGVLQSLVRHRDLTATLTSVARILTPGGVFGIDLVPDVANWREYRDRRQFHGRDAGATITLFETVRRDRRRRLTRFTERFVVRRGRQTREHRFDLVFRTLSMLEMTRLLRRAGFVVTATLGGYLREPWHARADVWILLAKKV